VMNSPVWSLRFYDRFVVSSSRIFIHGQLKNIT
jgi:hypothetical protein